MNIIKKGIAVLIVFSMILTSFATVGFANEATSVKANDYDRAVEVLRALKIMEGKENGDFAAEDFLTRSEMCAVAIRLLGMDSAKDYSSTVVYTDVADSHWAKGYIDMSTDFGLVSGNGDGTFEPDAELTAEQAIKILVSVLGYQPKAEDKGGFPAGYLYVANQLDLMKGASFPQGYTNPISRGNLAILVYNSLDKEIMEKARYGEKGFFAVNEETDLLGAYHNIKSLSGVIEATDVNSLDGNELQRGDVTIDGVSYATDLDMTEYIGYYVDFYCYTAPGDSIGTVVAFFPVEQQTERTEIEFDDVNSITVSDNFNVEARYYKPEGGREKTISLEKPVIIYNGKTEVFATAADEQNFINEHMVQGKLTFQKKVKSTGTNILFIDNYKAYMVLAVDAYARKIIYDVYTRYGIERGELDLSTDDKADREVLFYDAYTKQPILMGDIANYDVIEVYESSDGELCKVYRAKNKVTGTVERRDVMDNSTKPTYGFEPFKTVNTQGFGNEETTYHSYLVSKTDGDKIRKLGIDGNNWWNYRLGANSAIYPTGRLEVQFPNLDKGIPSFANGMVAWVDRGVSIPDPRNVTGWSSEAAGVRFINIFDEGDVTLGDKLKITAWVYANNMGKLAERTGKATTAEGSAGSTWVKDTTSTTVKTQLSIKQTADMPLGLYDYAPTDDEIAIAEIELDKWQPITLTYEINEDNIGSRSISIDNSCVTFGDTYPKNLFVSGVEIEKLSGAGYNPPTDLTDYEIFIDDVGYKATEQVYTSLINMSDEVTLYLDSHNRIAGFERENTKSNYGLLLDVGVENDNFGKDYLKIKMLDSDGVMRVYDTLDKVKAWDGNAVSKLDAKSLITNEPIDIETSNYLWSTNNSRNFSAVNRVYLTDDTKSDFASRKIVYYETNKDGKISKILVPTIPEDNPEAKICMVRDFHMAEWENESGGKSETLWFYAGPRLISFRYAWDYKGRPRKEMTYRVSNTATVYEALALNYDENDYSLIPEGPTALVEEGTYNNMKWDSLQMYKYPKSDTIDFMTILPARPATTSTMVVEQVVEREEGFSLKGYVDGVEKQYKIRDNTRLFEYVPLTSNQPDAQIVTNDMLPQLAEEKKTIFYATAMSDYIGKTDISGVERGSLQKGDIVKLVLRGDEIAWIEVARRIANGVPAEFSTTYKAGNMSASLFGTDTSIRGVVTDVEKAANTVTVDGYYWYCNLGHKYHSSRAAIDETSEVHEMSAFLHVTASRVFTVYDVKTGDMYQGSIMDIDVGDYIYSYGYTNSPRAIVLIKNEP